jgi:hypothetical protein
VYQPITPEFYRILQPNDLTHAGSTGWSRAPVPGWGANPLRMGPPMLGAAPPILTPVKFPKPLPLFTKKKRKPLPRVIAIPPTPKPRPYPVHRFVPKIRFADFAYVVSGATGRFPKGPAYMAPPSRECTFCFNGLGMTPVPESTTAQTQRGHWTTHPALPFLAVGGGALALIGIYLGIAGGIGYAVGSALSNDPRKKKKYRTAGAVGNILMPGVGLIIGTGLVAMQEKDI